MTYTQKQINRFWSNVNIGGVNDCWNWQKARTNTGYGQLSLRVNNKDRVLKAHKVAHEITTKKHIEPGVHCLHMCDNKLCCNPSHIYLQGDLLPHTLRATGSDNGRAKLTERQAIFIKYRFGDLSTREVAEVIGCSYNCAWDIRHGKTWRHI